MSLSGCCSATLSTIGEWILNSDQWDRSVGEPDTTHRKPWVRLLHNITITFTTLFRYSMLLIFSTIILWFDEFSDEHELKPVIAKLISFVSRFFAVAMFVEASHFLKHSWAGPCRPPASWPLCLFVSPVVFLSLSLFLWLCANRCDEHVNSIPTFHRPHYYSFCGSVPTAIVHTFHLREVCALHV